MPRGDKVRCLTCGGVYAWQGIGPHQRSQGHKGRETVSDNDVTVTNASDEIVKVQPVNEMTFTVVPLIVLKDGNGSLWLAEQIK